MASGTEPNHTRNMCWIAESIQHTILCSVPGIAIFAPTYPNHLRKISMATVSKEDRGGTQSSQKIGHQLHSSCTYCPTQFKAFSLKKIKGQFKVFDPQSISILYRQQIFRLLPSASTGHLVLGLNFKLFSFA